MATEHEIAGGEQRGLHMDDMHRGWGDSSSCRYYSTSSWRPWGGDIDIPSTAGNADSTGNGRDNFAAESLEYGSAKASECAEDNLGRASESAEDGWGEASHGPESPKASWGKVSYGSAKASECAEDNWDRASEAAEDGWGEAFHGAESPKASWGKDSESAGDGWDELYGPDCEIEESQEAEITKKCSGLTNLGNTCFMNSVLQCLTYTVPFANRVLESQHRLSCKTQEFCAMCAIENHIKVVLAASGRTVSPAFLARNLDQISRSFIPGQQQDAHEFLCFLLEGMQQHCKPSGSCQTQGRDTDLVSSMFMGQMKSQVKCKACSHCSDSREPFLGLNLEIEDCDSVKEALSNYVAVEDLQEEDKFSCSHCKEASSRSKQLTFSKSPQVLVIQLKRYKASEFFPTKVERDIKYKMSLDLTPFISQEDAGAPVQESDWHYNLYAVLVHSGWSTSSGHYYCFVQTSPNVWHCMNDSLVSRVSERTVLLQEAYILFYIRKGSEENLHLENVLSVNQDLGFSEGPPLQALESIRDDPYLCSSPVRDDSALYRRSFLNCGMKESVVSQAASSKTFGTSYQKQDIEVEPHIVCTQAKSPDNSKQVAAEKDSVTNTAIPVQQASKLSHSSSKGRGLCELEEPKYSPSVKRGSHELEELKPSSSVKIQSSHKAERISSPSPIAGCNQVVFDSFENGSQYSYVRLLNRMPSSRRHALLASAMSGQEATKQSSSPKATSAKDKPKPANTSKKTDLLQAGMGRASSNLLQKGEQQDAKGKHCSREKPWAEDHDYVNSRKLQRVGGKRVMAAFRSSEVPGEGKANIV